MTDFVIVRINEQLVPEFQINYDSKTNSAHCIDISAWSQIKHEPNQELILILCAVLVFSKEVGIPSKNEEVIKQSIPYLLEENLTTDIEDNHFAYNKSQDNIFNVCVVSKKVMETINHQLDNHQLLCKKLYSEIFTLPASNGIISILRKKNYFIVNDNNSGTILNSGLINSYIKNTQSKKVHVYTDKTIDLKDNKIEYIHIDTALYQAKLLTNNRSVNLLQGHFNKFTEKQNQIKPLKKVLYIAIILVMSWLFINIFQFWNLNNEIDKIKEKQQALLIKLLPNASQSEKNDPYSAMQSRLQYNQTNKSNNGSNGFIQSLLYVGQTLKQHQQVKISSVRQRENKLEIKVLVPNVSVLNQFQESLESIALARHVKTGTRESTKDGISSVITMEKL